MADPLTIASFCSGVGMLDIGVELACEYLGRRTRVACYCEWESHAAATLLARMEDSTLEPAPVYCGDLADFDGEQFAGRVDIVTAGFPCQPWSCAGQQKGIGDERWLWDDLHRIIVQIRPSLVFLENVPGLVSGGGLHHVLGSLAKVGFDAEWGCFTAASVGASHKRERVFILAHRQSGRFGELRKSSRGNGQPDGSEQAVGNPNGQRTANTPREVDHGIQLANQVDKWSTPRASPNENRQTKPTPSQQAGQHGMNLATEANEWITPNAMAGGSISRGGERKGELLLQGQAKSWTTPQAHDTNKRSKGQTSGKLDNGAGNACLATDAEKWATPANRDYRAPNATSYQERTGTTKGEQLPNQVEHHFSLPDQTPTGEASPKTSGQRLNPAFVCWLMGWPWWWTRAEPISFAAQEMELWRFKALRHLSNLFGE